MLKFIIFSFYLMTNFFSMGRRNVTLKIGTIMPLNVPLISGTCRCVTLHINKGLCSYDWVKNHVDGKIIFELSELVQCTHKVLKRGRECE